MKSCIMKGPIMRSTIMRSTIMRSTIIKSLIMRSPQHFRKCDRFFKKMATIIGNAEYINNFSSEFPLRTAFKLSYELKDLSHIENEFRSDYEKLSEQPMDNKPIFFHFFLIWCFYGSFPNSLFICFSIYLKCEVFAKELLDQVQSSKFK